MVDDMTGLLATWAPIVTGTKTPTRITMDELKKTIDFLINIKKNHARTFSASYGEAVDLFARGEVVTSVIGWDAMVGFAAAKNKVLDFVMPEEGRHGVHGYAVPFPRARPTAISPTRCWPRASRRRGRSTSPMR